MEQAERLGATEDRDRRRCRRRRDGFSILKELPGFDDRAALKGIDGPRLCFAGSNDEIRYGPSWEDVVVNMARPLVGNRSELEALGWQVNVLDGLDHMQAMHAATVLPILRDWLATGDD